MNHTLTRSTILLAVVGITLVLPLSGQQPNSPEAALFTVPGPTAITGTNPPWMTTIRVPGALELQWFGGPNQPVGLFAGTLIQPGTTTALGLVDLDLTAPIAELVAPGSAFTSAMGRFNLTAVLPASAAGILAEAQGVVADPTNPSATFTLTSAYRFVGETGQFLVIDAGDDSVHQVNLLGLNFPFYGTSYTQLWVNSNGNVTFTGGDPDFSETSGEFLAGLPRVALFWDDLDPTGSPLAGLFVDEVAGRVDVSWQEVPEFALPGSNSGLIRLRDDGSIKLAWDPNISLVDAIVGVSPGLGLSSASGIDLSVAPPFMGGPQEALYEQFTSGNPFDLAGTNLDFAPPVIVPTGPVGGGFGVAFANATSTPAVSISSSDCSPIVKEPRNFTVNITGGRANYEIQVKITAPPSTIWGLFTGPQVLANFTISNYSLNSFTFPFTFPEPGSYKVCATVTDANDNTGSGCKNVSAVDGQIF